MDVVQSRLPGKHIKKNPRMLVEGCQKERVVLLEVVSRHHNVGFRDKRFLPLVHFGNCDIDCFAMRGITTGTAFAGWLPRPIQQASRSSVCSIPVCTAIWAGVACVGDTTRETNQKNFNAALFSIERWQGSVAFCCLSGLFVPAFHTLNEVKQEMLDGVLDVRQALTDAPFAQFSG